MATSKFSSNLSSLVYDGEACPHVFIQAYKIQCTLVDWDDEKQAANLHVFLKGKAKRVLEAVVNGADKKTMAQCEKIIVDACETSKDLLMFEFYNMKRKPDESLAKFARKIAELLSKAVPNMDTNLRSTLLRSQLCSNAPANLRALIQFSSTFGATSWDKVIDMLDKSSPINASPMASYDLEEPLIKNEPVEANAFGMASTSSRGTRPFQPRSSNERIRGSCNYCHIFGHKMENCRNQQTDLANGIEQSARPTNSSGVYGYYASRGGQQSRGGQFPRGGQQNRGQQSYQSQVNALDSNQLGGGMFYEMPQQQQQQQGQLYTSSQQSNNHQSQHFPSVSAYNNSVNCEVATMSTSDPSSLLKVLVMVSLFGAKEKPVTALVDCGSSHSFYNPELLAQTQRSIVSESVNMWGKQALYKVNGATASATSMAFEAKAGIQIGSWSGEQTFVISPSVTQYDMILGKNFLNLNKVKMDFGPDVIRINEIQVNTTGIELKSEEDNSLQEDQLAASLTDMRAKLEKLEELAYVNSVHATEAANKLKKI